MDKKYIEQVSEELEELNRTRDHYRKYFWINSKKMSHQRRQQVKKLFMKIDRLRNHLKLWLKQVIGKKPINPGTYYFLIERSKQEAKESLKQLDKTIHAT